MDPFGHRYRAVCCFLWNDDKFPYCSDDCKLVWFHLFTNPLSSPLGIYKATIPGLAAELHWSEERYRKAFDESLRKGFVKVDERAMLIAFPKWFRPDRTPNHPHNPNVVIAWGKLYHQLPSSPLKQEVYQSLKSLLEGFHESFMKAFLKAFGESFAKDTPNREPYPYPEPEPEEDKREKSAPRRTSRAEPPALSDADWLKSLQEKPAYAHVNVEHEYGKCTTWCETKKKKLTRSRFVNWLNRIERPMTTKKPGTAARRSNPLAV